MAKPETVVKDYVAAINSGNYAKAWALYHLAAKGESYAQFVAGFRGTDHDVLRITGVAGETVNVDLVAYQTDGQRQHYTGSYTVRQGRIVASHIAVA